MPGLIEFPYRHKAKVVAGFLTFFVVGLSCLVGLAFFLVTGHLGGDDFMGIRGGKLLIAIPFVAACVALIPYYLIRTQRGTVRVTDSDLNVGSSKQIPLREIRKIEIQQANMLRIMYVHASQAQWAMISESMLPDANAFDQVLEAILKSRNNGWRKTESPGVGDGKRVGPTTTWSAK